MYFGDHFIMADDQYIYKIFFDFDLIEEFIEFVVEDIWWNDRRQVGDG